MKGNIKKCNGKELSKCGSKTGLYHLFWFEFQINKIRPQTSCYWACSWIGACGWFLSVSTNRADTWGDWANSGMLFK